MHFWKSGFWVDFGPIFGPLFLTIFWPFLAIFVVLSLLKLRIGGLKKGVKNGSKSLQEGQQGSSRGSKSEDQVFGPSFFDPFPKTCIFRHWFWRFSEKRGPKRVQKWGRFSEGHWHKSCCRVRWIVIFLIKKMDLSIFWPKSLIWSGGAQHWRARASARASFVYILRIFWVIFFWNLQAQKSPYFGWV